MKRGRTTVLAFAAGLVLASAVSPRGSSAEEKPSIEPGAAQTLKAALERIGGAASFTFRAEITNETPLPSGQKIQFSGKLENAVRRPNGFRSVFDGEERATKFWYDGKISALLNTRENVYACSPAPGKLEELLDTIKDKLGFTPLLAPLLREKVATTGLANVRTGYTVGAAVIAGVACKHLAFRGENNDWQIWITEGADPVIKRIVIIHTKVTGAPEFSATFLDWDFKPSLTDVDFISVPPPGAAQCEFQPVKP